MQIICPRAVLLLILLSAAAALRAQEVASAKYEGAIVDRITLTTDGKFTTVSEADLRQLLVIRAGDRYQAITVKQCIQRLFNTHLFFDIQADVQPTITGHVNLEFKITRTVFVNRISLSRTRQVDSNQRLREV